MEVADIYHDNLEDPINQMASNIPALFSKSGNGLKDNEIDDAEEINVNDLDTGYEACRQCMLDAPSHARWAAFQESDTVVEAKFGDVQKRIILANDAELNRIYTDLCPSEMEPEEFWRRWRFWNAVRWEVASSAASDTAARPDGSTVPDEEWEEWE